MPGLKQDNPALKGLMLILALIAAGGCSSEGPSLRDGYYTAEAASFDARGWKEYISIYVSRDRIITAEYNAKNISGFQLSWDMDYMRRMNAEIGTYPNKYARAYTEALLSRQNPALVEAAPGAAPALESFRRLAEAALARAKNGDKTVAFIELPDHRRPEAAIDGAGDKTAALTEPPETPGGVD